jgi:hypothetical protein
MYSPTLSLTSALDGDRWSMPRPGRFTPGKDPVPTVREDEWGPGPIWTSAENLASTGIRSPDRPARSESLYRLSYPAPQTSVDLHLYSITVLGQSTRNCRLSYDLHSERALVTQGH